jgi:hypothetical protein
MDSNHRCPDVNQESSPLDHGISGSGLTGNRTRISGMRFHQLPTSAFILPHRSAASVASCWTMSPHDCVQGGSRETRTHNGVTRTCFQDRPLIRPDDFRLFSSCGSWNRTNISTFRASHLAVKRSRNVGAS